MLLDALGLSPHPIGSDEAADIFRRANRAQDVAHDDDTHELNFEEFHKVMLNVAQQANSSVEKLLLCRPDLCGLVSVDEAGASDEKEQVVYTQTSTKLPAHLRQLVRSKKPLRLLRVGAGTPASIGMSPCFLLVFSTWLIRSRMRLCI